MVAIVSTVAYLGLEARAVEVQCQIAPGMVGFAVVGLPDKAVAESRERVRAAIAALGLSLPPKRITINLSPADLPKEGSHYDLPIALALLSAMGLVDTETLAQYVVVGELGLDGRVAASPGVLLAALHASGRQMGLICPAMQGAEAAWAGQVEVIAAPDLLSLLNHLKGQGILRPPEPGIAEAPVRGPDLKQVKGQETAKRALEIAAAGGHNLLMVGPPGAGKSLLASCLPGILPELTPAEALEVSMIASVAGALEGGRISRNRPFRAPHHSASMPALVGGGLRVRPGEVSLAHLGILFLDELPEFQRVVLDSLRQPLETGEVSVALEGDGRNRDDRTLGELGLDLVVPGLALGEPETPAVVMDGDLDMVGIVERSGRAVERGVVELPFRRGDLPDQLCEVVAVLVVAGLAAFGGEVELVPPLQLRRGL